MIDFNEQLKRIKKKISEAKKIDSNYKVFGASKHKYIINQPATLQDVQHVEEKYSIVLPECYKSFVLNIGNGGVSYNSSAAGPYYGIFPLGTNLDELIYYDTEKYIKNDCIIYPKMSDEYWASITEKLDDDNISDEQFEKEKGKLWSGILPIGSQGCSYIHGIVLNGKHKGMVVNLDTDGQKPQFTFEENFLDWYERWLDEIISGDLIIDKPSWFGYKMGGTEKALIEKYILERDESKKRDCLEGLLKKKNIDENTLDIIERDYISNEATQKLLLLELLVKFKCNRSMKYLIEYSEIELLSVLQFINRHEKGRSLEWVEFIESKINETTDHEVFRICTYILESSRIDYGNIIKPFTKSRNEDIRATTFYALGKLKNKIDYLDCFIGGLQDESINVIRYTLQALSGIKDKKLLVCYKQLSEKFPEEKGGILSNLNNILYDFGLNNVSIKDIDIEV